MCVCLCVGGGGRAIPSDLVLPSTLEARVDLSHQVALHTPIISKSTSLKQVNKPAKKQVATVTLSTWTKAQILQTPNPKPQTPNPTPQTQLQVAGHRGDVTVTLSASNPLLH